MTEIRSTVSRPSPALVALPALFVVLWSTGFIGAKLGLPYAEPLTFLFYRYAIVAVLMLGVSRVFGVRWPVSWRQAVHIAVSGLLVLVVYLGGVFVGIWLGVSAGVSALIVGLQPLLAAGFAGLVLGEVVTRGQWIGLGVGLVGVALVVQSKLVVDPAHLIGLGFTVMALFGMTAGTLYQKRYCGGMDLCSGTVIQNGVAAMVLLPAALCIETMRVQWVPEFIFALGWACLVLSMGATLLFFLLLRRGAAAKTSSLLYLVPPCTAIIAYFLFGETLGPTALGGMALAMIGVILANRS